MKKTFVIIGILVASTMFVIAQSVEVKCAEVKCAEVKCVEVKGVETRKVDAKESGFEFDNSNSYTVTVEAELRVPSYAFGENRTSKNFYTVDTKTFVIDAKEKYFWKTDLSVNYGIGSRARTYVVFKVFKCQE